MTSLRKIIIGSVVALVLVGTAVLGLRSLSGGGLAGNIAEITPVELIETIRTGDVASVTVRTDTVELTTRRGAGSFARIHSDAIKESVTKAVFDQNVKQPANKIVLTEVEASPGFGWNVFVVFGPIVLFFGFWAATLGVVIWAVRRLSGNKG